jgi:hypothetical protein
MKEAIAWVKRCPNPMPGDSEIEIRPIFEAEDFGEEFTPELRDFAVAWRRRLASVRLRRDMVGWGDERAGPISGMMYPNSTLT